MKTQKDILIPSIYLLVGIVIGFGLFFGYYQTKGLPEVEPTGVCKTDVPADVTAEEPSDLDEAAAAYLRFKQIKAEVIPSGVPALYGQELRISFDRVQEAIDTVRVFGPTYGTEEKKIILTGNDLARYINIGSQTTCRYCCGVKTLVNQDGRAACGCAHSIMMRGLAAYLIKNFPNLSDEEIVEELNVWRRAYFPKQTLTQTLSEMQEAGEPGIEEILEEFPDFLPQMVGGC